MMPIDKLFQQMPGWLCSSCVLQKYLHGKTFRQRNRNQWPVHERNIQTSSLTDSKMKIPSSRLQVFFAQRNSRKSLNLASLQLIPLILSIFKIAQLGKTYSVLINVYKYCCRKLDLLSALILEISPSLFLSHGMILKITVLTFFSAFFFTFVSQGWIYSNLEFLCMYDYYYFKNYVLIRLKSIWIASYCHFMRKTKVQVHSKTSLRNVVSLMYIFILVLCIKDRARICHK